MFDDQSPIYRQIAQRIKADIVSGAIGADEQVMSTTQYASFYGINPATAAKAFADLVDEGVLYKRRGVGMFVAADAREKLIAARRADYFTGVLDPAIAEARAIGVPLNDIIRHLTDLAGKDQK